MTDKNENNSLIEKNGSQKSPKDSEKGESKRESEKSDKNEQNKSSKKEGSIYVIDKDKKPPKQKDKAGSKDPKDKTSTKDQPSKQEKPNSKEKVGSKEKAGSKEKTSSKEKVKDEKKDGKKDGKKDEKKDKSEKSDKSSKSSKSDRSGKEKKAGEKSDKKSGKEKQSEKSEKSAKTARDTSTHTPRTPTRRRSSSSHASKLEPGKKENAAVFQKGPVGTLMSVLYMFGLWGIGGVFTTILIRILLDQVADLPLYYGRGAFVGSTPKLVYDPNAARFDRETRGSITFDARSPRSFLNLIIRYKRIFKFEYTPSDAPYCENVIGRENGNKTDKICKERIENASVYGPCAFNIENIESGMGFQFGEPCIMLRLTKILGFFPQFDKKEEKDENNKNRKQEYLKQKKQLGIYRPCPEGAEDCCHRKRIIIKCSANDTVDFVYYPEDGMSSCQFPYWNQTGYQQPFMMVHLRNLTTKYTEIKCSVRSPSRLHTLNEGEEKNEAKFVIHKIHDD